MYGNADDGGYYDDEYESWSASVDDEDGDDLHAAPATPDSGFFVVLLGRSLLFSLSVDSLISALFLILELEMAMLLDFLFPIKISSLSSSFSFVFASSSFLTSLGFASNWSL